MTDWDGFRHHRQAVIADHGAWWGLMDEEMRPLCDLPALSSVDAPVTRNAPAACKLTLRVRDADGVHPIVDHLVADGLARIDEQGRLIPVVDAARFVMAEYPGGGRTTYKVVYTVLTGDATAPTMMEINGVDELQWGLGAIPAMSAPYSWTSTWARLDRDWAGPWSKPRDLSDIQVAEVADGFTLTGPADITVEKLINQSLDALARTMGRRLPIHVIPVTPHPDSPAVALRPTDGLLWDEIASTVTDAGLTVRAGVWLPGDEPVEGVEDPTLLISIQQGGA